MLLIWFLVKGTHVNLKVCTHPLLHLNSCTFASQLCVASTCACFESYLNFQRTLHPFDWNLADNSRHFNDLNVINSSRMQHCMIVFVCCYDSHELIVKALDLSIRLKQQLRTVYVNVLWVKLRANTKL